MTAQQWPDCEAELETSGWDGYRTHRIIDGHHVVERKGSGECPGVEGRHAACGCMWSKALALPTLIDRDTLKRIVFGTNVSRAAVLTSEPEEIVHMTVHRVWDEIERHFATNETQEIRR